MAVNRRPPPTRPSPKQVAHLDALAALHVEWTAANADTAGFDPKGRKPGGDYNVHHVDLDADQAALDDYHRRVAALR